MTGQYPDGVIAQIYCIIMYTYLGDIRLYIQSSGTVWIKYPLNTIRLVSCFVEDV